MLPAALGPTARALKPRGQTASTGTITLTLLGDGGEAQRRLGPFLLSFALHLFSAVLIVISIRFVGEHGKQLLPPRSTVIDISAAIDPYVLPPSLRTVGGGGGGGDHDKLAASKGGLPKSFWQQIVPPMVVVRNQNPKLTAEPTVVVPPEISLPHSAVLGDPLSTVMGPPSNGTGSGGGIGSGSGGGVGSGRGPGVGPGWGGGIGGGVFRVGGGVSAPRLIYGPDPEFSEEARKAKYQGTVVLWLVVGSDGRPRDIQVQRSLGMGLDKKALEAVRQWRFEPAHKDGMAVAVQVNVEVNFRLY